ncbi:hypothetical protein FA13DRAFT_1771348, partial [Coprinellus micaceus]
MGEQTQRRNTDRFPLWTFGTGSRTWSRGENDEKFQAGLQADGTVGPADQSRAGNTATPSSSNHRSPRPTRVPPLVYYTQRIDAPRNCSARHCSTIDANLLPLPTRLLLVSPSVSHLQEVVLCEINDNLPLSPASVIASQSWIPSRVGGYLRWIGGQAKDVLRCAEVDAPWPGGALYPEIETIKPSDSLVPPSPTIRTKDDRKPKGFGTSGQSRRTEGRVHDRRSPIPSHPIPASFGPPTSASCHTSSPRSALAAPFGSAPPFAGAELHLPNVHQLDHIPPNPPYSSQVTHRRSGKGEMVDGATPCSLGVARESGSLFGRIKAYSRSSLPSSANLDSLQPPLPTPQPPVVETEPPSTNPMPSMMPTRHRASPSLPRAR